MYSRAPKYTHLLLTRMKECGFSSIEELAQYTGLTVEDVRGIFYPKAADIAMWTELRNEARRQGKTIDQMVNEIAAKPKEKFH
jgi:hypothetical protein